MSTTFAISLIVRNEEQSLGRCLDSVQGLGDEIVVVDTGSTDGTREVAAGRGARVFDFPWCDDFAAARNETLRSIRTTERDCKTPGAVAAAATGEAINWSGLDCAAYQRDKNQELAKQLDFHFLI
jgi:glycosyltransferase involved in cell wall biosynthesis